MKRRFNVNPKNKYFLLENGLVLFFPNGIPEEQIYHSPFGNLSIDNKEVREDWHYNLRPFRIIDSANTFEMIEAGEEAYFCQNFLEIKQFFRNFGIDTPYEPKDMFEEWTKLRDLNRIALVEAIVQHEKQTRQEKNKKRRIYPF